MVEATPQKRAADTEEVLCQRAKLMLQKAVIVDLLNRYVLDYVLDDKRARLEDSIGRVVGLIQASDASELKMTMRTLSRNDNRELTAASPDSRAAERATCVKALLEGKPGNVGVDRMRQGVDQSQEWRVWQKLHGGPGAKAVEALRILERGSTQQEVKEIRDEGLYVRALADAALIDEIQQAKVQNKTELESLKLATEELANLEAAFERIKTQVEADQEYADRLRKIVEQLGRADEPQDVQ